MSPHDWLRLCDALQKESMESRDRAQEFKLDKYIIPRLASAEVLLSLASVAAQMAKTGVTS